MPDPNRYRRGQTFTASKKWKILREIEWCVDKQIREQKMQEHNLSVEEILEWRRKFTKSGRRGLRITRSGSKWA